MCSGERRALDGACSYTRMGGADGWLGALQARGSSRRMREYQVDDPSSSRTESWRMRGRRLAIYCPVRKKLGIKIKMKMKIKLFHSSFLPKMKIKFS